MLRRPSDCLANLREEGCSSTAFGGRLQLAVTVWDNPASRGFVTAN